MCLGPGAPASAESCRSPGLMAPDPQGCKRSQKPRTLCKTPRSENMYTGLKGLPPGGHQPSLPIGHRGTPASSSDFVGHPGGVAKGLGNRLSTSPAHRPASEPWGHGSDNGKISPMPRALPECPYLGHRLADTHRQNQGCPLLPNDSHVPAVHRGSGEAGMCQGPR